MATHDDAAGRTRAHSVPIGSSADPSTERGLLSWLRQPDRAAALAVITVMLAVAAYLHYALRGGVTGDYSQFFLPWYETLDQQGFAAFSTNFANYNFPYLFLLLLTTYLPVSSLIAVKLIAAFGDLLLALAVFRLVRTLRPEGLAKWIATAAVLIAPSVFLVSAYWGQVDSIYTAFLLLSVSAVLRRRYNLVWLWWGIALAFKLQAIFLLPFLLIVVLRRSFRWQHPLIAAAVFLVLSIPPLFAGNSLAGTFGVYLGQTTNQWLSSYGSASVYEWIPSALVPFIGGAGTAVAFAIVFTLCLYVALRFELSDEILVRVAFLGALLTPLLLPFMHDRYFYPAIVLAIVLAVLRPGFIWATLVLQAVAIWSYMQYLAGDSVVPLALAPALVILVAWAVGRTVIRGSNRLVPREAPSGTEGRSELDLVPARRSADAV